MAANAVVPVKNAQVEADEILALKLKIKQLERTVNVLTRLCRKYSNLNLEIINAAR